MLRPEQWLFDNTAFEGSDIWLNLPERGIVGLAHIDSIDYNPTISKGKDRLVLTTMNRLNDVVL